MPEIPTSARAYSVHDVGGARRVAALLKPSELDGGASDPEGSGATDWGAAVGRGLARAAGHAVPMDETRLTQEQARERFGELTVPTQQPRSRSLQWA
jgi:hypothetical protein